MVTGVTNTVDVRRRRLLICLAGLPMLGPALAACADDAVPKSAPGHRLDVDMDVKVRWRAVEAERALLGLYAATLTAHPGLSDTLAPFTARHTEHLDVLVEGGPLPFSASDPLEPPSPGSADVPADAAAALAAVAEAESAAAEARVADCLAASGSRFAAVLASVAACEAAHAATLESA